AALALDRAPLALLASPFRAAIGLPCPGSGDTRAFHFAVRGRVGEALAFSPRATAIAAASGLHAVWTMLRLAGLPYPLRLEDTPRARWLAAIAIVANWIFVSVQGRV